MDSISLRVSRIARHLDSSTGRAIHTKSDDDIVIIDAVRTPITRARTGGLKDKLPEELLAIVLKALLTRTRVDPALVQDICVGNVLPPGGGATVARMAALFAGFPTSTSLYTVNRQCSSGLQAVANIANAIKSNQIDIGIGAGVESMTKHYGPGVLPENISAPISELPTAADCLIPMGITSENVAAKFSISRSDQDAFALDSHRKAWAAQNAGFFDSEIIPVGSVMKDDGIRADTTIERLSRLKPAFSESGCTTAGNSSQVSDGAAAVLLAKRSVAEKLGLKIKGQFLSYAVVGVEPKLMGIGPAKAIPKALDAAKLCINDVDVFELNEAFASQSVMVIENLKLPKEKVNPNGGAIALGHPLGCTGARQIATLLPELKRKNKKIGVVTMCIGTGMGAAAVIQSE